MSQRIKMARALNLISDGEVKMLQALSKMRNTLAHNAKETDFTFEKYFENKDRKRSFADNFATIWPDKVNDGDKQISRLQFVGKSPVRSLGRDDENRRSHGSREIAAADEERLSLLLKSSRAEPHVQAVSAEEIEQDLNRKVICFDTLLHDLASSRARCGGSRKQNVNGPSPAWRAKPGRDQDHSRLCCRSTPGRAPHGRQENAARWQVRYVRVNPCAPRDCYEAACIGEHSRARYA
jgi:hypothetical protein